MTDSEQSGARTVHDGLKEYADTHATIPMDEPELDVRAGVVHIGYADGQQGGVHIIQDGGFMALVQGVDYEGGDKATVGHDMTPETARELAEELMQAADNAEEAREPVEQSQSKDGNQSLTSRVISRVMNDA